MFYAHFVLSKKGPLARIWLAAHWDKKLTRSQVFETNITSSVEAILEPKVKLALRTSGHLLLGVVRIHSRQAKYLLSDCNEAFVKIKMAFRPGADVTDDCHRDTTSLANITLNEMNDFESTLADINDIDPFGIAVNQSRPEDITMREEFGEPNLGRPDDDFGDSTFEDTAGDRDFVVEQMNMDSMEHNEVDMTLTNELVKNSEAASSHVFPEMPSSVGGLMGNNDSDFADVMDYDSDSVENLDMFQDTVVTHPIVTESMMSSGVVDSRILDNTITSSSTIGVMDAGHSMGSNTSCPAGDDSSSSIALGNVPTVAIGAGLATVQEEDDSSSSMLFSTNHSISGAVLAPRSPAMVSDTIPVASASQPNSLPGSATVTVTRMVPVDLPVTVAAAVLANRPPYAASALQEGQGVAVTSQGHTGSAATQNTRLPQFVLPPIDRSVRENRRVPKRKLRKLLIDEHKSIPSEIMKLQMQDTSEITTRLDLAPPTRKLMLWKETGNVEALFATPGRSIPSRVLQKLFYRNMKTVPVANDAPGGLPPIPGLRRRPGIGGLLNLDEDDDDQDQDRDQEDDRPVGQNTLHPIHEGDDEDGTRAGAGDLGMPSDGACSTYSANYDCWSTHGGDQADGDTGDQTVPTRLLDTVTVMMPVTTIISHDSCDGTVTTGIPGIDSTDIDGGADQHPIYHDNGSEAHLISEHGAGGSTASNIVVDEPHRHQMQLDNTGKDELIPGSSASPSLMATGAAMSPISHSVSQSQSSSMLLDMSIHKARQYSSFGSDVIGLGSADGSRMVHDMSVELNASLDRSVMSGSGVGNEGGYPDHETTLTSTDIDIDIGNGGPGTSNKLQTTMVMLDQQLDKVNEEYPLEITQEGLEKRSEIMLNVLRNAIKREGEVDFHHLTVSNNKKQAASKFYTLLLLGKQKKLTMVQETPYSNIIITLVEPEYKPAMEPAEEMI